MEETEYTIYGWKFFYILIRKTKRKPLQRKPKHVFAFNLHSTFYTDYIYQKEAQLVFIL